ncbi:hypothetical protein SH1V18_45510 [Vallitalea longa]|uniref:MORN repeat protein n=1 Tax=Vallitalea longa TaxID=2936439 RepID=A0A9W6DG95_9FIRM|nr:hypothetical protein [Vallitalea longa]GKX32071.1 hypothetical protein SH1V18_45510 [Vallitalea longa]
MGNNILTKENVMKNGVNFEKLYNEYCSDRILDKAEDKGGKLFTGLVYELNNNGQLAYYCFYKDGLENGQYVEFYENGNVQSVQHMKHGTIVGKEKIWFKNGMIKSVGEYEYGVCLNLKEWNEKGVLINQKLEPTEKDKKMINNQKDWHKTMGRE